MSITQNPWNWEENISEITFHPSFWRIECSNMIIKKLCIMSSMSPKLVELELLAASICKTVQLESIKQGLVHIGIYQQTRSHITTKNWYFRIVTRCHVSHFICTTQTFEVLKTKKIVQIEVLLYHLIIRDKNFQNPFRPFFHFCQTASIFRMTASQKQKILKSYRQVAQS